MSLAELMQPWLVIVPHILERNPVLVVWKIGSCTRIVDVPVSTAADSISDVGTTSTSCAILEGMWIGDVRMLSVHMVGMLRGRFLLPRDGSCQISRQEDEDL